MVAVVCVIGPLLALVALPGGEARRVGAWLTPGMMLVGLADFFAWILKGRRRVHEAAVVQVGTQGVLSLLCVAALLSGRSLLALLAAFWLAGAAVLAGGPLVLRWAGIHLRLVPLTKSLFRRTGPNVTKIGAVIILSVAFTRVDLLLVSGVLGATAAGYFGASGRMVDALQIVPTVANGTLLPRFSALRNDPAAFGAQLRRAFVVLLALSVIAAAFCAIFAAPLLSRLLGGSYEKAAPVLRPLAWSCIPMFLNMLGFSALYALHDHRTLIAGIGVALALELGLDVLWLPRYGVVAAGWSRLVAEVVNTIIIAAGLARRRPR
jgi:O-antigen/teichoic acid export membrane protein